MSGEVLSLAAVAEWSNLLRALDNAAKGKRSRESVASYELYALDHLTLLQQQLLNGNWRPGDYRNFVINEPKRRLISAAPFADRVVHHALVQVIEPWYERRFVFDSYANRRVKGNLRAVLRAQQFSRRYRFVLQLDIKQHFASIDHQLLQRELSLCPMDLGCRQLCNEIIDGGAAVHQAVSIAPFAGDDLLSGLRPRGLPVGNLTSQFWSNVYLNRFDHFIKRELRCGGYVRYVDDMLLFSNSKKQLWHWRQEIVERLHSLRLQVHCGSSTVYPAINGIPYLGFQIYPHRLALKRRGWLAFARRYRHLLKARHLQLMSASELRSSVRGWLAHASKADAQQLVERLLLAI